MWVLHARVTQAGDEVVKTDKKHAFDHLFIKNQCLKI